MHAVFTLPDEIARTLVALLERDYLEALTSVSWAAQCSFYQAAKTVSATTLLLSRIDEAQCSRLLHSLARHRSDWLREFVSIQVAASIHVSLLLHPSVRGFMENVRLLPFGKQKAATVVTMCEKLRALPHLYQLDVSDTKLKDLSAIVSMTQLRAPDLSRTRINRMCGLEALTNLQALTIEDAKALDMTCIEDMANLRVLRVKLPVDDYLQRDRDKRSIHIPPLKKLTKLHTLNLPCCTILSVADLVSIAGSLRTLSLIDVRARTADWILDPSPDLGSRLKRDIHEQDLVEQLTQLEKIHVVTSDYVLSGNAESLARIPSVRVISHALQFGLNALTTLVHLEELNLNLPQYQRFRYGAHEPEHEDFGFLPHLHKLTTLRVEQSTDPLRSMPASPQRAQLEAGRVCEGLVQLPRLKRLYYEAYVDCAAVFPKLRSLERLELRYCRPHITSYEWIRSMTSLRSLDIDACEADTDLSAIGALTHLEEFCWIVD